MVDEKENLYFQWIKLILKLPKYNDGEGNGTQLQYSCLENPMDGGAWWTTVHGVPHGVAKSRQDWATSLSLSLRFQSGHSYTVTKCRARRQTWVMLLSFHPDLFLSPELSFFPSCDLKKNSSLLFRRLFAPLMICLAALKMWPEDCFRGVYNTQVHRRVSQGLHGMWHNSRWNEGEVVGSQLSSTKPGNREVCKNQTQYHSCHWCLKMLFFTKINM